MRAEVLSTTIQALKEAGIDFVCTLPSSGIASLIEAVSREPAFIHVPVAHENDAIAVAAGAWLGGKKPAIIIQNSGLVMATYSLMCSIYFSGGIPFLLIIDHKGDFFDDSGPWFYGYGHQVPKLLDNLQVLYAVVRSEEEIRKHVVWGQRTAVASGRAAAVLFSGRELME